MYRPSRGAVTAMATIRPTSCAQPASVIRSAPGRGARPRGRREGAPRARVRRCSRRSLLFVWTDDAVAAVDEDNAECKEHDDGDDNQEISHESVITPTGTAHNGLDAFF